MSFYYKGTIPASKSSFNRALIIQSFNPKINLSGEALCDDIQKMKLAIHNLKMGQTTFDCGEAGTVLRFFALRVSREQGVFTLTGKERLFKRPQKELEFILNQLGVHTEFNPNSLIIKSNGWKIPTDSPIRVSAQDSSQFLSGIVLSSWSLNSPLQIEVTSQTVVSESYFNLTLKLMQDFGFNCEFSSDKKTMILFANQVPKTINYTVESDLSSAFAVAALAALQGQAIFENFPYHSSQPDRVFIELLEKMGAQITKNKDDLIISKNKEGLKGISSNLKESPDLFPVLCALASTAKGESHFFGAPHLRFKESDRIEEVIQVLSKLQINCKALDDGALINLSQSKIISKSLDTIITLDAKEDHRLVMMGAVLKAQGLPLNVINTHSVNKSFPEFLEIAKEFL